MFVFNRLQGRQIVSSGLATSLFVLGACLVVCAQDKPRATNARNNPPLAARTEAPGQAAESPVSIDQKHPLYTPLQEAYKARETLKGVKDYECEFTKRELIGRRLMKSTMQLKLREEPFSVYLKFLDVNKGREVIYIDGRNKGNLLVHETGIAGLVGTIELPPTGSQAMADNKYPVTLIGMKLLVDKLITQWEEESKFGEVQTQKYPDAELPSGEKCIAYEAMHPTARKQFKFHITRMWIDKNSGLPIRVEQLGFPQGKEAPPVLEEYTYSKVKTNVPLGNSDFDTNNPKYGFR